MGNYDDRRKINCFGKLFLYQRHYPAQSGVEFNPSFAVWRDLSWGEIHVQREHASETMSRRRKRLQSLRGLYWWESAGVKVRRHFLNDALLHLFIFLTVAFNCFRDHQNERSVTISLAKCDPCSFYKNVFAFPDFWSLFRLHANGDDAGADLPSYCSRNTWHRPTFLSFLSRPPDTNHITCGDDVTCDYSSLTLGFAESCTVEKSYTLSSLSLQTGST